MVYPRRAIAVIVLALTTALVAGPALPASAHAQLISSTPSSGARLDTAPSEVVLEFSDDVLTLGVMVVVADASGTDWVAAEPQIDHSIVRVPVKSGMPEAGYEMRWRVVSADGHPISGIVPFTVGAGLPIAPPESPEPEPSTPPASEPGDASEQPGTGRPGTGELDTQQFDIGRTVLIGVGGAAAAVLVYVLILIFRRRRIVRADSRGTAEGPRVNS